MRKLNSFSGIVGGVFILFAVVGGLLIGALYDPLVIVRQPILLLHLLFGSILVLYWFFAVGLANLSQTGIIFSGRGTRFGLNVIFYTTVVVAGFVFINWLANRYDSRWDLTEEGVYSLSPQTRKILEALEKPLQIVAFRGTQNVNDFEIENLLKLYKQQNRSKITTEIIDARSHPHKLDQYRVQMGNLIYIGYGDRDNLEESRLNEASEESITNAILKLTRGSAKKIYFIEGHSEPQLASQAADGLAKLRGAFVDEHFQVSGLILSQTGKIPDDAAAVVLVSPKKKLLAEEKQALIEYVDSGGRLLMMTDPKTTSDVKEIADNFGIVVRDDIVLDPVQRLFAGPAIGAQPIVRNYGSHIITRDMNDQHITIYNIASSVTYSADKKKLDPAISYAEIALTGPNAWGEKNLEAVFDSQNPTAQIDPEDTKGPVSLAIAYEKKVKTGEQANSNKDNENQAEAKFEKLSRVVVVGDSDWALNANLEIYANRDFVLNIINWLSGEEGGISIRAKSMRASIAPITSQTFVWLLGLSFLVPELILLSGLMIWWSRRSAPISA
ncbi:MAG TPA: Gldg family protein [Oligoflexia bacterium]|nr:Gldg family protein [Oligoflexia bacterium]HMP27424.1 Gldg family protein [Oligoflexia bacterium]